VTPFPQARAAARPQVASRATLNQSFRRGHGPRARSRRRPRMPGCAAEPPRCC
jgi:hypothetical protein